MEKEIRILFVEDVPAEADLVNRALEKSGMKFRLQRTDTQQDFLKQLEQNPPDVILSDHGLPSFTGFEALAVAKTQCPGVPFIFVTSALTPEMEIEKLAPGVTDLVPKHDLSRLGSVIRKALTQPEPRRQLTAEERSEVIRKLQELLAAYETEDSFVPVCSSCKKFATNGAIGIRWNLILANI